MAQLSTWKQHYWFNVPVMRSRIEEAVKLVNGKGKRVLEVGCNEGFLSQALLEDGCDVLSTDINPEYLKKAEELFDIRGVMADAMALPFPDQSFDIVVAGEILEHLGRPFRGLDEFFRVAKEKVVVTIPIGEYWLGERSHIWELNGAIVDHDKPEVITVGNSNRHILILSWTRRRTESLQDIAPFSTGELTRKYDID